MNIVSSSSQEVLLKEVPFFFSEAATFIDTRALWALLMKGFSTKPALSEKLGHSYISLGLALSPRCSWHCLGPQNFVSPNFAPKYCLQTNASVNLFSWWPLAFIPGMICWALYLAYKLHHIFYKLKFLCSMWVCFTDVKLVENGGQSPVPCNRGNIVLL